MKSYAKNPSAVPGVAASEPVSVATMLKPERFKAVLIKLFFAWLYSFSLSRLLLMLHDLPLHAINQGLIIVLVLTVAALLTWQRYSLLILSIISLLALLSGFIMRDQLLDYWQTFEPQVIDWFNQAGLWLSGQRDADLSLQTNLARLLTAGMAFLSYLFVARFNKPFFAAAGLIAIIFLLGDPLQPARFVWILISGSITVAMLARKQRGTWRLLSRHRKYTAQASLMIQALPIAFASLLVGTLLAVQITPAALYSRQLEGFVDDLANRMVTPVTGEQAYSTYSIADVGYYPLLDRLGGPVELSDEPILHVSGYASAMLLRGLVAQEYDGQRWYRDDSEMLYRFGSDMNQDIQTTAFNLDLPDYDYYALDRRDFQETIEYRLQPARRPIQTLFVEGRPTAMRMENNDRYQFFFNMSGQLYSKYWIQNDESVRITGRRMLTDQPTFAEHVYNLTAQIPQEEQVASLQNQHPYLQLPPLPEYLPQNNLATLSDLITHELDHPLDKAIALRDYLIETGTYNLDVPVPPEDQEFVTWVLETGEGYCVYYATALTMLARLQGIPARYVEGFYAPPSTEPGGYRLVTGEYAHAWTEIYLAGIGWIALDATPGGDVFNPQATPEPTPEPTITPDAGPDDGPDVTPEATPTLPLSPQSETSDPDQQSISWQLISVWLIILVLAGLYLLLSWRTYRLRHQPGWLAEQFTSVDDIARWYRQEIGLLLNWLHLPQRKGETLRAWLKRLETESDWFAGREAMTDAMIDGLETAIYAQSTVDERNLQVLAESYDLLEEIVWQNAVKPVFMMRRVLKPGWLTWRVLKTGLPEKER